jgi:hypothetical protein
MLAADAGCSDFSLSNEVANYFAFVFGAVGIVVYK